MPKRALVDLAMLHPIIVSVDDRHAAVFVKPTASTACAFTEIVGVSVGNGSLNDESAFVKTVSVAEDFKLVVSNAICRIRLIENVAKVTSNERVVGTIDTPT